MQMATWILLTDSPAGEYICIAFADGSVMLHSREGTALADVAQLESPVTSLAIHNGGGHVAMACQDGHLSVHQLTFATVHGLYLDCYAFRWRSRVTLLEKIHCPAIGLTPFSLMP